MSNSDVRRPNPQPRASILQSGAPSPESRVPSPQPPAPRFACLFIPPVPAGPREPGRLRDIAQAFSPRYELHGEDLVSIDLTGLERLFGDRPGPPPLRPGRLRHADGRRGPGRPSTTGARIGESLMNALAARHVTGHVAIAGTRVAALVLAHTRPGLTVIDPGGEALALAPIALDVLARVTSFVVPPRRGAGRDAGRAEALGVQMFGRWALRTLGELAALPTPDLVARVGRQALVWQAVARGEDVRPLVPTEPEECFDGSLELEWPIEGLEPLSFVLTRLLEPLSTRLERRDRGAAVLHVTLDLVTREVHARHLQLPTPIRDVRTLRTLALLDIESHPPAAAIDRVTVVIEPTPGRIVQHTLFARALPTPERLSTLLARLTAVMGQDRVGAPVVVDTYRPGAFAMRPFPTEQAPGEEPGGRQPGGGAPQPPLIAGFRRCRQPVPARVVTVAERPVRVTSDRAGFPGGSVIDATGPWCTSGHWWEVDASPSVLAPASPWDRCEWEVTLSDGARYRVFQDRLSDGWFIDGMFD